MSITNGKGAWLQFRAGDEEAFTEVFQEYYRPLCYFANKLIFDEAQAEDIASETLTKFWQKGKEFTHHKPIKF